MKFHSALYVLSVLVALTEANDGLRGSPYERELQYYGNYNYNDDINGDDNTDDVYSNSTASTHKGTGTAATGNLTESMHQIQDIVINQVQQYKAVAQAKGYEFYNTSPSDWTSSQWDFVTALLGGLILACCFFSVCCAYCCIYRSYDDDGQEMEMTKAQYHRYMLNHRLNRHRARYNEKRYDRDDDTIDDNTIDDTVYTAESQSTYGQSYYEPETPTSYASSIYISRREEKKRADEKRRKEERRKERDEKRESLLKKSRDEKKESLLKQTRTIVSPVTHIVKVANTPVARTRSSTPVRSTKSKKVDPTETKEEADKKAVDEALSYKMHP